MSSICFLRIDLDRFDVTFCYSSLRADDNFRSELTRVKERGIPCVQIEMTRRISPGKDLRALWRMRNIVRAGGFDLVHGHSSKAGFLSRLAAKSSSRNILTIYTPNSMSFNIRPIYRYIEKIAAPLTDMIIAGILSILVERVIPFDPAITLPVPRRALRR